MTGYTPLKYVISGKPLIAPEPEVGKSQNWAEMKVNYPTDKENTQEDSDNFRNIKNFVQVDHFKKFTKNSLIFPIIRSQKAAGGRKIFKMSSNTDANFARMLQKSGLGSIVKSLTDVGFEKLVATQHEK